MAEPDTDAEIVARAIKARTTPGYWDAFHDADTLAEVATSALAAAGRLTPAGGETGTEYNLRFRNGSGRWTVDDELTSYGPEDDWPHTRRLFGDDVHQVTRTVTIWPDDTRLVGPWRPVPEEDTDRES